MAVDLTITVDGDQLRIESAMAGLYLDLHNLALVNGTVILSVGETAQEFAAREPAKWSRVSDQIKACTVFDAVNPDFELTAAAVSMFCQMPRQTRPLRFLFTRIDCQINFPNYDRWPENIRRAFEFLIRHNSRLSDFWINGQKVTR